MICLTSYCRCLLLCTNILLRKNRHSASQNGEKLSSEEAPTPGYSSVSCILRGLGSLNRAEREFDDAFHADLSTNYLNRPSRFYPGDSINMHIHATGYVYIFSIRSPAYVNTLWSYYTICTFQNSGEPIIGSKKSAMSTFLQSTWESKLMQPSQEAQLITRLITSLELKNRQHCSIERSEKIPCAVPHHRMFLLV